MHVTFEYIAAAGLIFVMLAMTTAMTSSLNYIYTTQKTEFQLVEVAESALDKMLLHSGDPRPWGTDLSINVTNTDGLAAFGLSTGNQNIYRLDPDKVGRLHNGSVSNPYDNYYYVPPEIAANLLGLGRDYGFKLSILPIFKVDAETPPTDTVLHFNVSSQTGAEIPSANVTVYAFWPHKVTGKWYLLNATLPGITDWRGSCHLDFAGMGPKGVDPDFSTAVFIVVTDFHGLQGIAGVDNPNRPGDLFSVVVADRLFLSYPEGGGAGGGDPQGAMLYMDTLKALTFPYVHHQESEPPRVVNTGSKQFIEYRLDEVDPYSNAFLFIAKKTGNYWVSIALRPPPCIYQTQVALPPHASTVVRLVDINGFNYFVRFTLWRMSE